MVRTFRTTGEHRSRMLKKTVQQGRSERRGEGVRFRYVELLSEVRTPLADFFSILLDQRLLRLHGWLERSGWIYCIWKGAGSSILAFEFF